MALCTLVKLKKLSLAQQVVTGAFINGALIGVGVAALALMAASGRRSGQRMCSPAGNGPETSPEG
ncbi:MAG: hypothetical protein AAF713_00650 [Pseudomonadota bacterium]